MRDSLHLGHHTITRLMAASLTIILAFSCKNKGIEESLNYAESIMWTIPDSALMHLNAIDTSCLKTNKQRARYCLLYTMALDRNHIDTSDLRVIRPATLYYELHGSSDDKMKMYFYLGVVQQNGGDHQAAISSFMQAKEYSKDSPNIMFKGLIASTISDIYCQDNNYLESLRYAKEALSLFNEAGDSTRMWVTTGMIAALYINTNDYNASDSLYRILFSLPCRDSSIMARHLMNKALSELWRTKPNPQLSVDLFKEVVNQFHSTPTVSDYCAYAYALELLGNRQAADNIMSQLNELNHSQHIIETWNYRIYRSRKQYKEALGCLEKSVRDRDSSLIKTTSQSVALAQSDYYQSKSEFLANEKHIRSQRLWIIALAVTIAILVILIYFSKKRRSLEAKIDEISQINDSVSRMLSEERITNENYRKKIHSMEKAQSALVDREEAIKEVRSRYIQTYRTQLNKINNLCAEYWESIGTSHDMERVYAKVKKIASEMEEGNESKLETMLNDGLDGIMTKLHADLPNMTEKDFRFIAFLILGFDAKTTARMTGYTVQSVYTKRNRLKKQVAELDSENRDLYLEFLD